MSNLIPSTKLRPIFPSPPPGCGDFGSYLVDMIKRRELGSFSLNAPAHLRTKLYPCIESIHNPPIIPKKKRRLKSLPIFSRVKITSREDAFRQGGLSL